MLTGGGNRASLDARSVLRLQEEEALKLHVSKHGKTWAAFAKKVGRNGRECRRYFESLRNAELGGGAWTAEARLPLHSVPASWSRPGFETGSKDSLSSMSATRRRMPSSSSTTRL
jgi:hypothetical protein